MSSRQINTFKHCNARTIGLTSVLFFSLHLPSSHLVFCLSLIILPLSLPAWRWDCMQSITCWGDTCHPKTPQNKFTTLLVFTAHLAPSVFWHSVKVTLGEVFSAAHWGGETHSRGCQLRLTLTLHPAAFPSGLLFHVVHRTLSENSSGGIPCFPTLGYL